MRTQAAGRPQQWQRQWRHGGLDFFGGGCLCGFCPSPSSSSAAARPLGGGGGGGGGGRDARCRLLRESLDHISNPDFRTVHLQATAMIQLEDDPNPLPKPEPDEIQESQIDTANPKKPR